MRIMLMSNTSWSLVNFRLGLARFLRDEEGHAVTMVAPRDSYSGRIEELGFSFVEIPMSGSRIDPLAEFGTLMAIFNLLRQERPDALLTFTPKPNIYGGLVSHYAGVPIIQNVAGLGRMFIEPKSLKARLVAVLYRLAMKRSAFVFFQNPQDHERLLSIGAATAEKSARIFGSGVDTAAFHPDAKAPPDADERLNFLLFARLLKPKGIEEYAAATSTLRKNHPGMKCGLLGPVTQGDPLGYSLAEIEALARDSGFSYLGETDDVKSILARTDCVVLPSYYGEGVPRSLLEAAAMGIPIITTDSVGCRDAVEDGVTGWLVPPRSAEALANRMRATFESSDDALAEVGRAARNRAEALFHETSIFASYRAQLATLSGPPRSG
jgi:glycosyltransferase involved in cell wall biosynthesis